MHLRSSSLTCVIPIQGLTRKCAAKSLAVFDNKRVSFITFLKTAWLDLRVDKSKEGAMRDCLGAAKSVNLPFLHDWSSYLSSPFN